MPVLLQASMRSVPAGTVSFLPSTVRVTSAMEKPLFALRLSLMAIRFSCHPERGLQSESRDLLFPTVPTDLSFSSCLGRQAQKPALTTTTTPSPALLPFRTGTVYRRDGLRIPCDTSECKK